MDVDVPRPVTDDPYPAAIRAARGLSFPRWAFAAAAAAGVAITVCLLSGVGPIAPSPRFPSSRALLRERTTLRPGRIELDLRNGGASPITVSQVAVDSAFWYFEMSPRTVPSGARAKLIIDYPWQAGRKLPFFLLTSSGKEISDVIVDPAVSPTDPPWGGRLILLVGAIALAPAIAALSLWWAVRRAVSWRGLLGGVTLGVLAAFLMSGIRNTASAATAVSPFVGGRRLAVALSVTIAFLILWVRRVAAARPSPRSVLALIVAAGIGTFAFGRGLALGHGLATGAEILTARRGMAALVQAAAGGLAIFGALSDGEHRPRPARLMPLAGAAGAAAALGVVVGRLVGTTSWTAAGMAAGSGALAVAGWYLARTWLREHPDITDRAAAVVLVAFLFTMMASVAA